MQNFQKSYTVLGVFHDDDWETIRAAYKRQIRRWHPDKFQDPEQKNIAEIKSRELNQAFQLLDDYYRENGLLPSEESGYATARPSVDTASRSQFDTTTPPTQFRPSASTNTGSEQTAPLRRGRKRIFLLVVAILAGYLLVDPQPDTDQNEQRADHRFATQQPIPALKPEANDGTDPYLAGSQLGVTDSVPAGMDNQLHESDADGLITIGSSMKEVLKIQGTPFRQTDTSWEYGLSRIDFRNGRVVGWHESPMNPLVIKR